jgi:uncharacterized pyridoxamine 5'-phosphate oxidase family protein
MTDILGANAAQSGGTPATRAGQFCLVGESKVFICLRKSPVKWMKLPDSSDVLHL